MACNSDTVIWPTCLGGASSAEDLVGNDSDLCVAFEDGGAEYGGVEEAIGLDGAVQVGVIECFLRSVLMGNPSSEGVSAPTSTSTDSSPAAARASST